MNRRGFFASLVGAGAAGAVAGASGASVACDPDLERALAEVSGGTCAPPERAPTLRVDGAGVMAIAAHDSSSFCFLSWERLYELRPPRVYYYRPARVFIA